MHLCKHAKLSESTWNVVRSCRQIAHLKRSDCFSSTHFARRFPPMRVDNQFHSKTQSEWWCQSMFKHINTYFRNSNPQRTWFPEDFFFALRLLSSTASSASLYTAKTTHPRPTTAVPESQRLKMSLSRAQTNNLKVKRRHTCDYLNLPLIPYFAANSIRLLNALQKNVLPNHKCNTTDKEEKFW